jgi:hypothetical protein
MELTYHETTVCDCGHHEKEEDVCIIAKFDQTENYRVCLSCWHMIPRIPISSQAANCGYKMPEGSNLTPGTPLTTYIRQLIRTHKSRVIELYESGKYKEASINFEALKQTDKFKLLHDLLFTDENSNRKICQFFFNLLNKHS